jgi:hypothetical protein
MKTEDPGWCGVCGGEGCQWPVASGHLCSKQEAKARDGGRQPWQPPTIPGLVLQHESPASPRTGFVAQFRHTQRAIPRLCWRPGGGPTRIRPSGFSAGVSHFVTEPWKSALVMMAAQPLSHADY